MPSDSKLELVYNSAIDGANSKRFHDKCDFIPNTLTVIKTIDDYVFGGYTSQTWSGENISKLDASAFVFSLINKENTPFKIQCEAGMEAIRCYPKYGPVFGACDICIFEKRKDLNGYVNRSNLGKCYKPYLFQNESQRDELRSLLAGKKEFQIKEIEVFHVL